MTMMQRWRFHIEMLSLNLTVSMVMLLFLLLLSFLNASFRIERTPRRRSTRKGQMALEAHSWPKRPAAPIKAEKRRIGRRQLANFLKKFYNDHQKTDQLIPTSSDEAPARLRQGYGKAPMRLRPLSQPRGRFQLILIWFWRLFDESQLSRRMSTIKRQFGCCYWSRRSWLHSKTLHC